MESIKMNEKEYNLISIESDCWSRIMDGVLNSSHPFNQPVFANANTVGANMRTVVLRKASATEKTISLFTDIRSGKWEELQKNQSISWLFYDHQSRIQIRLSGKASLHQNDELANNSWANVNINSRKNYSSFLIPSTEINDPKNISQQNTDTTEKNSEEGRVNFGVVVTTILWMEWLWLNPGCHYKANFIYNNGDFTSSWLVP
jgi:pyridoxine/pyridoxamine 5'-phosphate oxidase